MYSVKSRMLYQTDRVIYTNNSACLYYLYLISFWIRSFLHSANCMVYSKRGYSIWCSLYHPNWYGTTWTSVKSLIEKGNQSSVRYFSIRGTHNCISVRSFKAFFIYQTSPKAFIAVSICSVQSDSMPNLHLSQKKLLWQIFHPMHVRITPVPHGKKLLVMLQYS